MKSKTVILMVVAIGCGLVASYMTSRLIAERQPVEEEKVTVLVARQNIPMGTMIKEPEKLFEEKQFSKDQAPKKALSSFDDLKDHRLNKPLSEEQFVTPDDVTDKSQDMTGSLPKGMRAVALKVNIDTNVAGWVLPHNRVDIVSVIRRGEEVNSRILLQNVLVLAVDQQNTRPEDGKNAVVSGTVTVQVDPQQAEKLSLATELGTLRLILRPFGDEERASTTGATPKNLHSSGDTKAEDQLVQTEKPKKSVWGDLVPDVKPKPEPEKKPEPPPPPPPPKTHTLTILNGESVTKAVFTLDEKDAAAETQIERSKPAPVGNQVPKAPAPTPGQKTS